MPRRVPQSANNSSPEAKRTVRAFHLGTPSQPNPAAQKPEQPTSPSMITYRPLEVPKTLLLECPRSHQQVQDPSKASQNTMEIRCLRLLQLPQPSRQGTLHLQNPAEPSRTKTRAQEVPKEVPQTASREPKIAPTGTRSPQSVAEYHGLVV